MLNLDKPVKCEKDLQDIDVCIAQLPLLLTLSIYFLVGKVKNSVVFTMDGVYL